ncbi:MAG: hypothetical protein JWO19_2905 [Bryobacterales bacterium]|nr:hypothetical protein [Bryobacterales bacterium]
MRRKICKTQVTLTRFSVPLIPNTRIQERLPMPAETSPSEQSADPDGPIVGAGHDQSGSCHLNLRSSR